MALGRFKCPPCTISYVDPNLNSLVVSSCPQYDVNWDDSNISNVSSRKPCETGSLSSSVTDDKDIDDIIDIDDVTNIINNNNKSNTTHNNNNNLSNDTNIQDNISTNKSNLCRQKCFQLDEGDVKESDCEDLIDKLFKLQASRFNDQRCSFPKQRQQQFLQKSKCNTNYFIGSQCELQQRLTTDPQKLLWNNNLQQRRRVHSTEILLKFNDCNKYKSTTMNQQYRINDDFQQKQQRLQQQQLQHKQQQQNKQQAQLKQQFKKLSSPGKNDDHQSCFVYPTYQHQKQRQTQQSEVSKLLKVTFHSY
ncbi:hypothetical protein HELRODRAFT_163806 [Helobdella robusta]|uniref:Uncharacterized protein n=1 Tax=Helobdella robusta TaxID=6412 RepID=T1EUH8_HELRO|nr:hypothetical protein HELRODRAFT_163806 [Helobdella robusta]ESN96710.1 hypothetical protein HELRODRAFT_163806 [Helobdella robusta]